MASVDQRGNTYRIRVSTGYREDGSKILSTMTWKPPEGLTAPRLKKELEKQIFNFEQKVRTGHYLDGEKITFAELTEKWLKDYAKSNLKPSTYIWYKNMLDSRILPAIGTIKLARLQPVHILQFRNDLLEAGIRTDIKFKAKHKESLRQLLKDRKIKAFQIGINSSTLRYALIGKNVSHETAANIAKALETRIIDLFDLIGENATLSNQTVTHYMHCISSIMSAAVEWQIIEANPCQRVKAPSFKRRPIKFLEIDTTQQIIAAANKLEDIRIQTAILIFIYTGIRKGELTGLEWPDIDLENGTITIQRSVQYIRGRGHVTSNTKTDAGERMIAISAGLVTQLKNYLNWQNEKRLFLGDAWQKAERDQADANWKRVERLFTSWDGGPIQPSTIFHWMKKFLIKNGQPDLASLAAERNSTNPETK